jgi:hypothetical protein
VAALAAGAFAGVLAETFAEAGLLGLADLVRATAPEDFKGFFAPALLTAGFFTDDSRVQLGSAAPFTRRSESNAKVFWPVHSNERARL